MFSEDLLSEAVQEALEYSLRKSEQFRHNQYEIYQWTEDGRMGATGKVSVPSAKEPSEYPPDKMTNFCALIEALVVDDEIPLIQSQNGAIKAFNRLIEEIRIETNRGDPNELRNNPNFNDALLSDKATIEYIAPIIGLSFDDNFQVTNSLDIRPLNGFEAEKILNTKAMGGGSVDLRRAIQVGNLTHVAVYEKTTIVDDGWEGGISIMSDIRQEAQHALKNLRIALRLMHPEGFQMGVRHIVDKTFYPSVIASHEMHGSIIPGGLAEPKLISNSGNIVEYYQLVSGANEDEGLRVAIDRLESSYRKISNADGVVDAIIGIEALLSSGRSGSFQEVRRRASILSREKATFSELGRLQSLRNATVHGEETQVDSNDLQQARDLLSILLNQVIRLINEKNIERSDVIDHLDKAITKTVENQFDELLLEFESV